MVRILSDVDKQSIYNHIYFGFLLGVGVDVDTLH